MTKHRIYSVSVASVYPYYVAKAERKGRTKAEVDVLEGFAFRYKLLGAAGGRSCRS